MKRFSKVLAVVLALITVLMALPLSVFADAWLDVDVDKGADGSTLTVTLDAKALAEILKTEGVSKELVSQILANASIDKEGLMSLFTVEELFQIFPREKILELLDLKGIIAQIGVEKLSTYIDLPALLAGCDKAALSQLLADVPDLYKYVEVDELIKGDYIPDNVIMDNVKEEELKAAVSTINPADVIPAIMALPTFAQVQELIRAYDLVLVDGVIDPKAVVNMAEAEKRARALFDDPSFDAEQFIDFVYADAARLYFQTKYSGEELDSLADLGAIRDLIAGDYFDVAFEFEIHSVDLVALLDAGLVKQADLEALVHDYMLAKFESMPVERLVELADAGCFTFDGVEVTGIDIYTVLDLGLFSFEELIDNCPGLSEFMDAKVDAWIDDSEVFNKLLDLDCVDVSVTSYQISNIDYAKIIRDGVVTTDELLANSLVNINGLATYLIENDLMKIDTALVDTDKLMDALETVPAATLFGYVNTDKAFEFFGAEQIIEWLGGYDKAMNCINIPGVTSDIIDGGLLTTILDKMAAKGVAVTDVFHLDELLSELDFAKIIEMVGINNIMAQLDNGEIRELLTMIDLKSKAQSLLVLFYNSGMQNIDKLAINDIVIAEEDETTILRFDAGAMVSVVKDLIPTLDELANLKDNTLTSIKLMMEYTPIGSNKTVRKEITVEFVLDGGVQYIKAAAAKLQALLSTYVNEFTISADRIALDINVPSAFGKAYAKLLDTDRLPDSLKQKLMKMTDLSGEEVIAFVNEKLTLEEILQVLEAIEPSQVFESAKNHAFVEACLAKVGKTVPNVTLDDVWAKLANAEYSIENVCNAIEAVTHRDVMAVLQKAATKVDGFANKAEEIDAIEKLLNVVGDKLGIDVSEISVAEILERGADVDLLDKISAVVAARVGINIRDILTGNTPDELWALAIEKAYEHKDIYNKVRNYLLAGFDKLPDAALQLTIVDLYDGNGVFAADKTISFQAKPLVEKALNKVLARFDNAMIKDAADLILSRVSDGTIQTTLFVAVRFPNIYKITYVDQDENTVLFTALVPVGARLDIFKSNAAVTGYKFTGWVDADGNEVAYMPNKDTVVYADYEYVGGGDDPDVPPVDPDDPDDPDDPVEETVTLTFVDAKGNVIGTITVVKGTSFLDKDNAEQLAIINRNALNFAPALSEDELMAIDGYYVVWSYNNGAILDLERNVGLDVTFEQDTTFVCDWEKKYMMGFKDPSVDFDIVYKNGVYTVTINGTFADAYALNIKDLLAKANADDKVTLVIKVADGDFALATIKNATLKSLYNATKNSTDKYVWFEYAKNAQVTEDFKNTMYKDAKIPCVSFFFATSATLTAPAVELAVDFGGETIDIQLPYANAIANSAYMTRVYTVDAKGAREYMTTVVAKAGLIEFKAAHFSSFIISDEYRVTFNFVPTVDGELLGGYADKNGDLFFPVGATFNLNLTVDRGYEINGITDAHDVHYNYGDLFTMPAENVIFTVTVHCREFHVYYYYFDAATGKLMEAAPSYAYRMDTLDKTNLIPDISAEALAAVPAGYDKTSAAWTALDETLLGVSDITLFVTWTPISYTIRFVDAANDAVIAEIADVTAENANTKYALPAVPAGMIGAWTVDSIQMPTDLSDAAQAVVTIVLSGTFEKASFPVTHGAYVTDETPSSAYAGETVLVKVEDRFGYTAQIVVKNDAGDTIDVVNGSFVMPASAVNVSVIYTAMTFTYTVNHKPATGTYMDTILIQIVLNKGEVLVTAPTDASLVSTEKDGSTTVLTYAFVLDGEKAITYKVESVAPMIYRVFNGALFTGGLLPDAIDGVYFERWSTPLYDSLSFAVFSAVTKEASLVWLWILIAVLALILILAVLYALALKGKTIKVLSRIAVAIVEAFFALCTLIAKLGLKIAKKFGKSDSPEDYGFTKDADK